MTARGENRQEKEEKEEKEDGGGRGGQVLTAQASRRGESARQQSARASPAPPRCCQCKMRVCVCVCVCMCVCVCLTGLSQETHRRSWLYLARRSERQGAPVLICPVARPTTRSAMKVSSVSPLRWLTITPQPAACASLHASMASVTLPIWFTLSSRQLQLCFSIAIWMLAG